MTVGEEEFTSKETVIKIDGRGIYKEFQEGLEVWRESDYSESLWNVGNEASEEAKGGSINRVGITVGNNFIHGKEDRIRLEFRSHLTKDGTITSQEEKGY